MATEQQPDQYPKIVQVIIIILITLFITFILGLIGTLVGAQTELFLLEGVIIIPAIIFIAKNKFSLVTLFRLRPINNRIVAISFLIGIAFTVVTDEIDRIVQIFFPMPEVLQQAIEASLKINSNSDLLIIVFSAVFLAATVEELLFRGFVQTTFEHHFDITRAVMATALIFAVIHFNPWWSIQMIIFGIILGVMAWKSDSILPPIIVHFVNNGIALTFANIDPAKYQWYLYQNHVSIPIVIFAILTTIYGMKLFYRFCDATSSKDYND